MKKIVSVVSLMLVVVLMLTGCSGGETKNSVKVAVTVPYVLEGAGDTFTAALTEGMPELNTDEAKMLIQTVSTGDPVNDPSSAMAGMTRLTAMFMAKEIEVLICDAGNAQRHGDGGEGYMALDKLFTAEEQVEMGIVPLTVQKVDNDGNATGELSDPCGISLAECGGVTNIFKMSDLGLYVIDTPESEANIENIRTAVRYILSME